VAGPVGSTVGVLTGVAVGGAATVALEPAFEIPRQDAWDRNRNKILDVGLLARLVAQGGIDLSAAHAEGHRDGFSDDKIDALVYLEQTVPGVGEALSLWRLGLITDALFSHVLVKAGLDQRYAAPLLNRKHAEVVGLGDIGYGVVRGILPSPSWVPVPPPTSGTTVPRFPQVNIDPIELANKLGFNEDMLQLIVGRSGLSLAPNLAAQALFRQLINHDDFRLAIAEGDLRTEWADTLRDASRAIPSAHDFVQKHLRGWTDAQGMYDGAARHGMAQADVDTLYQIERRPLSPHQIKQGLARGANFNPQAGGLTDPYEASVHQNNLGPEWYDLAISLQGSYPSVFITNRLVTSNIISADTGRTWLEKAGNADEVVTALHQSWTTGTTGTAAKADPHVTKAQNQVWTATHKGYVDSLISDATATAALTAAGVAVAAIPTVLAAWRTERDLVRKSLSAAQIKKAWTEQIPDPALGRPWTEAEAVTRLEELGYTADNAKVLLVE
jgi:hypothetical protein